MILVTGAGGKTGRAVVKRVSQVERICAFVHREAQTPVMQALGADKVILGDMRDETAVRQAAEGTNAIYHICPNMSPDEVVIGEMVIDAARKAGVGHFIYHSVLHPQTEKMNHHWQKMRVEEMLFESGLPFTILQPAPYMQNLLANWESIVEEGVLRVPYSVEAKFSFVDLEDIAEVANVVLTASNHQNAIYELAGTTPLSHIEVASIFEEVINREIRAEKEEIGEWKFRARKMDEYEMENLVRMFEYYDHWGLMGNPNILRWLLRRKPTSLEFFIERTRREHNVVH